ncbi:MAG: glycine cleavage system protein H, partial [Aquirufa sp.]
DPYGEGWIVKIKVENIADLDQLMDVDTYKSFIGH